MAMKKGLNTMPRYCLAVLIGFLLVGVNTQRSCGDEEALPFYSVKTSSGPETEYGLYVYSVTKSHFEQLPSFDPLKDEFPLSLSAAIKKAVAVLYAEDNERNRASDWRVLSTSFTRSTFNPKLGPHGVWYYCIRFFNMKVGGIHSGESGSRIIVLLMDGAHVVPTVEPENTLEVAPGIQRSAITGRFSSALKQGQSTRKRSIEKNK